jgi:hypothetical protein
MDEWTRKDGMQNPSQVTEAATPTKKAGSGKAEAKRTLTKVHWSSSTGCIELAQDIWGIVPDNNGLFSKLSVWSDD